MGVHVTSPAFPEQVEKLTVTGDLTLGSSSTLQWSTDLKLVRVDANVLAQRNSTTAQELQVTNTFTSTTSYEIGKAEWASNVFRVGTEKGSGGGTARAMALVTDDTNRLDIGATGAVMVRGGNFALVVKRTPATVTTAGDTTYSAANMLGGLILRDCVGASRADTTPTAAQFVAGYSGRAAEDTMDVLLVNTSDAAETITLTAGASVTLIPATVTIAQNEIARLTIRLVTTTGGSEAVTIYATVAGG